MKGDRYEFVAIPLVAIGLGAVFLVLGAGAAGMPWLVTLGFAVLVFGTAGAYLVMRKRGVDERREPVQAAPTAADGAYRVLVVTHRCSTAALASGLVERSSGRRGEAFVVALREGSRIAQLTGDEQVYADARTQLDDVLRALREAGLEAEGQVGSDDALQALDDGLREFAADEVLFAAASERGSAAFEQRVLRAARAHYAGPVSSLVVGS
jgi:hypothetical protein